MYILGTSLDQFGFIPGQQSNSNIALSGFLDMPARIGKTSHTWATENGVEPYVSADELFFGGRNINLTGFIRGVDRIDCENKRLSFESYVDTFTDLVPLQSKWGTNNVAISGAIKSDFLKDGLLRIAIPMREPQPVFSGLIPSSTDSELGIDGISFKDLGGIFMQLSGDRRSRPAPKTDDFTIYGKEGYAITNTVAPQLNIKLFIKQPTYTLFQQKVNGIAALLSSPGMRLLNVNNDKPRSFFCQDGFTVTNMYSKPDHFLGILDCKLIQVGNPITFAELTDSLSNLITDNNGNSITVRI